MEMSKKSTNSRSTFVGTRQVSMRIFQAGEESIISDENEC